MTSTVYLAAKAFADAFETRQRDDGAPFVCLADGRAAWMLDAVLDVHNGAMPCDYCYELARACVDFFLETLDDGDGREFLDDSLDAAHDFADSFVSVYNADAVRWLADDLSRADYIDQAREELGLEFGADEFGAGIFGALRAGMVAQALDAFATVAQAIEANADDYAPFAAGWNMPGCMPDVEAEEFADFDDAKAYILETLLAFEESDGEAADACRGEGDAEGFESLERNAEEYRAAAEELNLCTSAPVSLRAGAFVFWIVERAE